MKRLRGATFVEAAIALPIILIALLGVIDVCRYGFGLAMFQLGAHKGADFASKMESLLPGDPAIRDAGIQEVRDEVLRFVELTNYEMIEIDGETSPFISLPPPGQEGMIRIEVIAPFDSLIPFIGRDLFIRAQSLTSTLTVGSNLRPMIMCEKNKNLPECRCDLVGELCGCPPGQVRRPDGSCDCINNCSTYLPGTCQCDCPPDSCTGNYLPDPNDSCTCMCPANFPCPPDGPQGRWVRNMETCTCDCDRQALLNYCVGQNKVVNPDPQRCECLEEARCPNPKTNQECKIELGSPCAWFDYWACACRTCPREGDPRECIPDGSGSGSCRCPQPCGSCMRQEWNCACTCTGQNVERDGSQCKCKSGYCDPSGFVGEPKPSPRMNDCSCECVCPDGYQLIGNSCVDINE